MSFKIFEWMRAMDEAAISTGPRALALKLVVRSDSRTGQVFASQSQMADELDVHRKSIGRWISELEEVGGVHRRGRSMFLKVPGAMGHQSPPNGTPESHDTNVVRDSGVPPMGHQSPPNGTPESHISTTSSLPKTQSSRAEIEQRASESPTEECAPLPEVEDFDGDVKTVLHALDSISRFNIPFERIDEWLETARTRYADPVAEVVDQVEQVGERCRHAQPHRFAQMVRDNLRQGSGSSSDPRGRPKLGNIDYDSYPDEIPFDEV